MQTMGTLFILKRLETTHMNNNEIISEERAKTLAYMKSSSIIGTILGL